MFAQHKKRMQAIKIAKKTQATQQKRKEGKKTFFQRFCCCCFAFWSCISVFLRLFDWWKLRVDVFIEKGVGRLIFGVFPFCLAVVFSFPYMIFCLNDEFETFFDGYWQIWVQNQFCAIVWERFWREQSGFERRFVLGIKWKMLHGEHWWLELEKWNQVKNAATRKMLFFCWTNAYANLLVFNVNRKKF
jgi:hypothetical protein